MTHITARKARKCNLAVCPEGKGSRVWWAHLPYPGGDTSLLSFSPKPSVIPCCLLNLEQALSILMLFSLWPEPILPAKLVISLFPKRTLPFHSSIPLFRHFLLPWAPYISYSWNLISHSRSIQEVTLHSHWSALCCSYLFTCTITSLQTPWGQAMCLIHFASLATSRKCLGVLNEIFVQLS